MYSVDLAHIHNAGFGAFARRVAPEIAAILRRNKIGRGDIVEMGCGSGAVARHLTACRYKVCGWDISPAMIRLARRQAPAATFRVGSLASTRIPPCDAIVSVGEVVTYVSGGLPVLNRFFRRAYGALRPGGLLVFDFIESAQGRTYPAKTLRSRDWRITVNATFNPLARTLTRRMRIERRMGPRTRASRETHRVRVYRRASIVSALERCGFRVRTGHAFGRVRLLPGDVAVIAQKLKTQK